MKTNNTYSVVTSANSIIDAMGTGYAYSANNGSVDSVDKLSCLI